MDPLRTAIWRAARLRGAERAQRAPGRIEPAPLRRDRDAWEPSREPKLPPDPPPPQGKPGTGRWNDYGLSEMAGRLLAAFDLTAMEAQFLEILLATDGVVTTSGAEHWLRGQRSRGPTLGAQGVMIHKIRRKMAEHGIRVSTARAHGFYLTTADKRNIREILEKRKNHAALVG